VYQLAPLSRADAIEDFGDLDGFGSHAATALTIKVLLRVQEVPLCLPNGLMGGTRKGA
jgi:hypothetical protein